MLADNWYDVVPPPFVTLAAACLLGVLLWAARGRIAELARGLGLQRITLFGVDLQFTEQQASVVYRSQTNREPTAAEKATIRDVTRWLSPLAAQIHVLWVDDVPSNNIAERSMFLSWEVEVQTARSTREALVELSEKIPPLPGSGDSEPRPYFDLVISDWRRERDGDSEKAPAGLELLIQMRMARQYQPVIFYHGLLDDPDLEADRRRRAIKAGAIGATADPSELFKWTLFECVRMAFEQPNAVQLRRRGGFTPAPTQKHALTSG